jgi:hypothetical protein
MLREVEATTEDEAQRRVDEINSTVAKKYLTVFSHLSA